ncbi:MAG: Holliday junction helicase RuvA, holliday junction helicase RuvA [Candidatus Paceibacter sp.]|jgi:Holliday junction DNA helicase RuvA|nr:Holliday junction helicase RuvA, holliday junction helicase RuvA [Candidatus Paceibacter sp.]
MISQLYGKVVHKESRYMVVDVGGVGYKVFSPTEIIQKTPEKEPVRLWTHLIVREDALDLYGFPTKEELEFFEMLITISGIGPKSALSILNLASIATLKQAIASGDSTYLTKVSGIGKKNAEKIVLELKDKLIFTQEEVESASRSFESDSLEALKALGYAEREARDALKKVPKEITDTSECVKHALKILAKS